jgi:tetratricopeptide (TPR) repeat protein
METTLYQVYSVTHRLLLLDRRFLLVVFCLVLFGTTNPGQVKDDCESKLDVASERFSMETQYMEMLKEAAVAEQRGDILKVLETTRAVLKEINGRPKQEHIQKAAVLPVYIRIADSLNQHDVGDEGSEQLLNIYVDNCNISDNFFISWLLDQAKERGDVSSIEFISDLYQRAIRGLESQVPSQAAKIGQSKYAYGLFLLKREKAADAFAIHSGMLNDLEKQIGRKNERFGGTIFGLVSRYQDAKAYGEAEKLITRLQQVVDDPEAGLPLARVVQTYDAKGRLFVDMKRVKDADTAFRKALELANALKDTEPAVYATARGNLQQFRQIAETLQDDVVTTELRGELAHAESTYGTLDQRAVAARKKLVEHLQTLGRTSAIEALGSPESSEDNKKPALSDTYDDLLKRNRHILATNSTFLLK